MNRIYIVTAIVMLFMLPSLLFAECMNYEPDTVVLTGKIIRKTFPGPPNYESIKNGDEPETYWILISSEPFCVNAKTEDSLYSSESGIKQVQLVFMGNEYQKYKSLVGKNIIVSGQLFPMQTGHHHTKVLITVKEILRNHK
jgi:hypothetical protein